MRLIDVFATHPKIIRIAKSMNAGERPVLCGAFGSAGSAAIAAAVRPLKGCCLIITPGADEADRILRELRILMPEKSDRIRLFPAPDTIPTEAMPPSPDLVSDRLNVISGFTRRETMIAVAPVKAVISRTLGRRALDEMTLILEKGMRVSIDDVARRLVSMEYTRTGIVGARGEFSIRGGIMDIFPSTADSPVRADFLGDELETLRVFDVRSQRSMRETGKASIMPSREDISREARAHTVLGYLPSGSAVIVEDMIQVELTVRNLFEEAERTALDEKKLNGARPALKGPPYLSMKKLLGQIKKRKGFELSLLSHPEEKNVVNLHTSVSPSYVSDHRKLVNDLMSGGEKAFIASKQAGRAAELLGEAAGKAEIILGELSEGFVWPDAGIRVLTDREIFGERLLKGTFRAIPAEGIDRSLLVELVPGDFVVHENHGIGIYGGLKRMKISGAEQEYMLIQYDGDDRLYVPLSQMGLVQKYSSSGEYVPRINRLGGTRWARTKKRAVESLKDLTAELLDLYAVREKARGLTCPPDSPWQVELEAGFPYQETPDQDMAIKAVKADMESPRPMDRLICGDVGYGKTEVALRAAFKAAAAGRQVAMLVPTTILAEQHYNNFKERFAPFPVVVEMLSRFRSKSDQKEIIQSLTRGGVDVIIGTHRLLQRDIEFKDLGLVIIDEEQRFGVAHKERLKKLRKTVDVLTLTATPIPRTLYMSLSGARDMSMIGTPPLDRSPTKTYVTQWSRHIVREAILRELERKGQVFYVYNFVEDIEDVAGKVRRLVPSARIAVAHGQMGEGELERTMLDFMSGKQDVLLCTTIIESGIDIPNVNTIIIDGAGGFGLAQLYQLRGRVGRSASRAWAYLLYHKDDLMKGNSVERLKAIMEFTSLGSGYRLALRDLEIRGAGNLLGREQHGHMLALGFDLYCDLMERAIARAKGEEISASFQTFVDLKVDAGIPGEYIPDERQRIAYYRRMNLLTESSEVDDMRAEMKDRFGDIPGPAESLFRLMKLKIAAGKAGIKRIEEKNGSLFVAFADASRKRQIFGLKEGRDKIDSAFRTLASARAIR